MSLPGVLLRNWRLKSIALALALLLWITMRLRDDSGTSRRELPVDVQVENLDPDWVGLGQPSPASVSMRVHGSFGDLFRAALDRPVVVVPVDSVPGEDWVLPLEPGWVANLDQGRVVVDDFTPSTVRLRFERNQVVAVPVSFRGSGALPDGLALTGDPQVSPLFTQVRGPASVLDGLETVFLEPFDLGRVTEPGTARFEVALDTAALSRAAVSPATAALIVEAARMESRVLASVAVELPGAVSGWMVEPDSVSVVLYGAARVLANVDTGLVRVRLGSEAGALELRMEETGEARSPLVVEGLGRWIEGALEPDSVTVRKEGDS